MAIKGASLDVGTHSTLNMWASWYRNPNSFRECGYVRADQWYHFKMYNGTDTATIVTGVNETSADGITYHPTFTGGSFTFPFNIDPRKYIDIYFCVSPIGDLDFLSTLEIVTSADNQTVVFKGIRPPYVPGEGIIGLLTHNWASGLSESREWRTDIMVTKNRTEQRMQLRIIPRRYYDWEGLIEGTNRQIYENMLYSRNILWYLLPIWHELTLTTQDSVIGATEIYVDVAKYEFFVDRPVFIYDHTGEYEQKTISLISNDKIQISTPLVKAYPAGSSIVPGNYFESVNAPTITHNTSQISTFSAKLKTVYADSPEVTVSFPTYENHPIFPFEPNFINVVSSIEHAWDILDTGNTREVYADSQEPIHSRSIEVLLFNRDDIYTWFQFVYQLKGRLTPFWVPVQSDDLTLDEPITPAEMNIYVKKNNYTAHWEGSFMRRTIEITTKSGATYIRNITGSMVNPLNISQEILEISGSLGVSLNLEDILDIRFLELVRLQSDSIKTSWVTTTQLRGVIPILSLANQQITV